MARLIEVFNPMSLRRNSLSCMTPAFLSVQRRATGVRFSAANILGVVRLTARDPSFKPTEFNSGATLNSLLLQTDRRLLVAGLFDQVNGIVQPGMRVY